VNRDREGVFGRTQLGVGAAREAPEASLLERRSPGGGPGARGGGAGGASGGKAAGERGRERDSAGPGVAGVGGPAVGGLVSDRELRTIERDYPEGLTSVQIVNIFSQRGIRFSEATFRKYVQQGLLPRSRRVGRKGKHQGSLGMYPSTTVRRISAIKRLMASDYTIEDIQRRFLRYRDDIEVLERGIHALLEGFDTELRAPHFDTGTRQLVKKDLGEARLHALELVKLLEGIERRVAGQAEKPPGGAAPGGAEDLL
jgi:hypothetical protein